MAASQNGYKANDRSLIKSYKVPGGKIAMRKGSVATILTYVATEFHKTVEPLRWPGNWGYAERKIRGSSTTLSNHASGTAIDLNAPKHPLGKRGTFTSKQVKAIRKILNRLDGTVRWGGDYRGRKDEMHFEINKGLRDVNRVAEKIKSGTVTTKPAQKRKTKPAPGPRTPFPLKAGQYFGPKSGPDNSYSGFYNRRVGKKTDRYYIKEFAKQLDRRGWSVGKGKTWLSKYGNDGKYGSEYRALAKAFQRDQGLSADGLIGKNTWNAAFQNPVT